TANDPLCAGGDGLGPVYNATSCAACHKQGGVGGAGGLEHNVTMFAMRSRTDGEFRTGVVHAQAVAFQETLKDLDASLPAIAQPALESLIGPQFDGGGNLIRNGPAPLLQQLCLPLDLQLSQR